MLKGQKGITLIALVITIIVLLILAGVAVATLTGNEGNIFTNASSAVQQYNSKASDADNLILQLESLLETYGPTPTPAPTGE